jgi:hypothetical protein
MMLACIEAPALVARCRRIGIGHQAMQVYGSQGVRLGGGASAARRPAGSGFALAEAEDHPVPAGAGTPRSVGGIDTLLALQGIAFPEDAAERRKRAVHNGRKALDALDALKLSVLTGTGTAASLARLRSLAAELQLDCGDPRLDSVLSEIALRAQVELAKAERG